MSFGNMNQKGFTNIILVVVVVTLLGVVGYFAFVKKSEPIVQQPTPTPSQTNTPVSSTPTPTPKDETSNWQSHSNTEIGFSFKYPQTWKVEDGMKINTCCLNVFNSTNPYQGDFLKQNVMKAQFQYEVDASVSNKQQYIDGLIKSSSESEMETPISRSSVISVQNKNGLDIVKFTGGVGSVGYVIPRKQNFFEVLYVIVWNPDSTFEKVLSTLKFTNAADPTVGRVCGGGVMAKGGACPTGYTCKFPADHSLGADDGICVKN
ncbi:MAG: hypothetical protein G01um101433_915 [Parcubacteria group bacterium Gr01-1014_33]|nr:MAG: hypothetical protein G01um101433_915 [Parcubacteria group bacterium Gr01-1014_33]